MDRSGKVLVKKVIIDFACLAVVGGSVLIFFLFGSTHYYTLNRKILPGPKLVTSNYKKNSPFRYECEKTFSDELGGPVLIFFLFGKPYQRGFFCNDESLNHPFKESTVTSLMLYVVGFFLPVCTMLTGEYYTWKSCGGQSSIMLLGRVIPSWVAMAYSKIGLFGYGAAMTALATDIAKYTIGRLRPHFMQVCKPAVDCSLAANQHRYFEDVPCTAENVSARVMKELRLSFPSGHSSFSAYTMVWLALYLQLRVTWKGSKLLKHFLQFVCLMMAWFTAMTRISNYKHHWSDVLAGLSLGTLVALVTVFGIGNLFKERRASPAVEEKLRSVDYDAENGTQAELSPLQCSPTSYGGIRRSSTIGDG